MKNILPALAILLLLAACNSDQPAPIVPAGNTGPTKSIESAALGKTPRVSRYGDIWFAGQPTKDDWQAVHDAGIERVIDLRDKDEDRGYDETSKINEFGLDYQVFEVRKHDFSPDVIEPAVKALDKAEKSGRGTLVHCASSNRVGTLVAIWRSRQGLDLKDALQAGKAAGAKSDAKAREYIEQHPNP